MIHKSSAVKLFNERIEIGYFKAPISDLIGYKYGLKECTTCKTQQKLFAINPNKREESEQICIDCLKSIEIVNGHETVLGYVDLNFPEGEDSAVGKVAHARYMELIRTPSYYGFHGTRWMSHCDDFMDYIGTWEASDFTRQSADGNGKKLFKTMTIDGMHDLWDWFELAEDETEDTWEDCLYHAFECRHCKVRHGYWER